MTKRYAFWVWRDMKWVKWDTTLAPNASLATKWFVQRYPNEKYKVTESVAG